MLQYVVSSESSSLIHHKFYSLFVCSYAGEEIFMKTIGARGMLTLI